MKRYQPSSDDMANLWQHRATVPATIWAALLLAACLSTMFDTAALPVAVQAASASASAVATQGVPKNP